MPIIESHVASQPLYQGDPLRGVKLFLTGNTVDSAGGESVASKSDHWFSDADRNYLMEAGNAEGKVFQSEKERLEASNLADGGKGNETIPL